MSVQRKSSKNVDSPFFVEYVFFRFLYPAFQYSIIPSFHAAYSEDDRKKRSVSDVL